MKPLIRRAALGLASMAGIASLGFYGNRYWRVGRFLESTDVAYLQAEYTAIAPKVSGYVAEVLVEDNQPVEAGQVLAGINARDFKTALEQAKADVANAEADTRNLDAQLMVQNAVRAQAAASIGPDQATITFARQDFEGYHALVGSGAATVQRTEQADADYREKTALVKRGQAPLLAAEEQVEVLKAELAKSDTRLKRNKAAERQAALNLGYTTIDGQELFIQHDKFRTQFPANDPEEPARLMAATECPVTQARPRRGSGRRLLEDAAVLRGLRRRGSQYSAGCDALHGRTRAAAIGCMAVSRQGARR